MGVVLTGARPETLSRRVRALPTEADVRGPRNAFGTQRCAYAWLQVLENAGAPAAAMPGRQTPMLTGHGQAKDNHTGARPTPQTSSTA